MYPNPLKIWSMEVKPLVLAEVAIHIGRESPVTQDEPPSAVALTILLAVSYHAAY